MVAVKGLNYCITHTSLYVETAHQLCNVAMVMQMVAAAAVLLICYTSKVTMYHSSAFTYH